MSDQPTFQFSFRATLFTLMLAVLLTAVVLLGAAGYLYARFAVRNLGDQVLAQSAERVDQHVQHALDVAEDEAETLGRLFGSGWLDTEDHERATDYFLASLRARPGLSYLSFGTPTGKYYHAFRDREGALSTLWLLPQPDGKRRLMEFNVAGDDLRESARDIPNSVRTPPYERPYFIQARNTGRAIWTESYVFLGSGESLDVPGVSRAVPVYSPTGDQFLGVLTADFDLFALSRFLTDVELGADGLSFLVENTTDRGPRVIAHPDAAHSDPAERLDLTQASPDGDGRVTVAAWSIADPRVIHALGAVGDGLDVVPASLQDVVVDVLGTTFVGGFRHLGRDGGRNWVICMLIPEEDLFGDVRRMAKLMVLMGLGGILMAGGLSLLLSRRVSESMGAIARETREIGRFELTAKETVRSRIEEISTLANAVEEMKTSLRSFQKYVPSELVRQLLESGEEAELGGSRRQLTVYFSDIVGFTSISERLSPEQLVRLLSGYLDEMAAVILRNGGTVDKYIGDAIMAFSGAPLPHDSHPVAACRTALANQKRLGELRPEWEEAGLPPIHARIGLHTGTAMVGNFGSPNRLDYTAIGDTVNLASRLEGLNRIYGTQILISDPTQHIVHELFVTRRVDRVAVKGREEGMMIFELIGERPDAVEPNGAWIRRYEEGLDRYFHEDWSQAIEAFEAVLKERPDDIASRLMRERCREYETSPPAADWNGVFRAPK